jgi:hypothetical protein
MCATLLSSSPNVPFHEAHVNKPRKSIACFFAAHLRDWVISLNEADSALAQTSRAMRFDNGQ